MLTLCIAVIRFCVNEPVGHPTKGRVFLWEMLWLLDARLETIGFGFLTPKKMAAFRHVNCTNCVFALVDA